MVNLYKHRSTLTYTSPRSNQDSTVHVEMNVSKGAMDEFTAGTIAADYIGKHLFSRFAFDLLPMDRKDAIVLNYNRKSFELEEMKRKLHQLDICEYLLL